MSRFFERHRAFDLAATLLVVLLTVSIADIDDHDMFSQAMRSPLRTSMSLNAPADISPPTAESGSDSEDVCVCPLCIPALSDSTGPRILPPVAGKPSPPVSAGIADSPHLSEIFHPPSA